SVGQRGGLQIWTKANGVLRSREGWAGDQPGEWIGEDIFHSDKTGLSFGAAVRSSRRRRIGAEDGADHLGDIAAVAGIHRKLTMDFIHDRARLVGGGIDLDELGGEQEFAGAHAGAL